MQVILLGWSIGCARAQAAEEIYGHWNCPLVRTFTNKKNPVLGTNELCKPRNGYPNKYTEKRVVHKVLITHAATEIVRYDQLLVKFSL